MKSIPEKESDEMIKRVNKLVLGISPVSYTHL